MPELGRVIAPLGLDSFPLTFTGSGSAADPEVPPPRSRWRILIGPPTGGYEAELTAAQSRKLTVRLTSPSEVAFGINARLAQAEAIEEMLTDVHVLWTSAEGVTHRLFRGRVGPTGDTGDEDEHTMTATVLDYRAMLARRRLWHGTSLNTNDSFEDGLGHWGGFGGTFELDDGQHQERAKSGRITPDGVSAVAGIYSDNVAVTAGEIYVLAGWLRCAVARQIELKIDWRDAGDAHISDSSITLPADAETWVWLGGQTIAPVGADHGVIIAEVDGTPPATDILWLDSASISRVPDAHSVLGWHGVDQAEIAWGLIVDTQQRVGGDLGISKAWSGTAPTGVDRDRTFLVGDSIGDRIQELSEVLAGFDWDITPTSASGLALNVWYPERGNDRGVVLEYGGMVSKFSREVQTSQYANTQRYTGADSTTPSELAVSDLATRPEGRWDSVFGDTGLTTQDALDERASWQLDQSQAISPPYTLTLRRGSWMGPDHIWVGDRVRVVIRSGRIRVDTSIRVHEMAFSLDADGGEIVEVTAGGPKPDFRRRPTEDERRLKNLERR